MDISSEKISELLKNPEIVGMIASLASGFAPASSSDTIASENDSESKPENKEENENQSSLMLSDSIAPDIIPKGKDVLPKDKRIALLQAIKPYVSDSKKDKVDSLVRAIGVAGLLSNYAGGIPGFIFGKK